MASEPAAAEGDPSKALRRHSSVEHLSLHGSHTDDSAQIHHQPSARRLTDPVSENDTHDGSPKRVPHRAHSLTDIHAQGSNHGSRRASSKDLIEPSTPSTSGSGQYKRWSTRRGSEKQLASPREQSKKGWGLGKVVARHEWVTDEGDEEERKKDESRHGPSKGDPSADRGSAARSFRSVAMGLRFGLRKGSDSDDSSKRPHSEDSLKRLYSDDSSQHQHSARGLPLGGSEDKTEGEGANREQPNPVSRSPKLPVVGLDESYRNHYLPGVARAESFADRIESSSAPVKIFPGERKAGGGGLEEAVWSQERAKRQQGAASDAALGLSMDSISEHGRAGELLHPEIEAVPIGEGPGSRKASFKAEPSTPKTGLTEEVYETGGEESESAAGKRRDEGQKDGKQDPFDNDTNPLPGTEPYGMTQVDDYDTIQSTTQGGDGLGPQFKATWQEWQNRYKGVDAEQYAPSQDGSHDGGSSTRVVRQRQWSDWLRPPMIHPFSRAHRDINIIITLAIVYTMLTLPFQLCFNVELHGAWLTIEFLVDVIFLVDVAMNFRTGYVEKQRDEVRDGLRIIRPQKIVMRPRRVARHYLRSWFVVDLVSSLPYDLLLVANVGQKAVNIVQFLRLFRLFRLHRLMLAQAELQETWTTTQYEIVEMCLLIFYLVYLAHVGACIFVAIGRLENSPQRWLEQFSWNQGGEAVPLSEARPFVKYSAALYWAVITLTSVGYGDIYPSTTRAERVFATLFITVDAIFLGYIGGNIAALLILRGQRTSVRREKFSTLHAFIEKEDIPEWLATRITVHMTRQWNLQAADFDEEQMLEDLTDELRMDLMVHWWRRTVVESDLFPHKRSFLTMLLEKCKTEQLAPGSVLCQAGELLRHVYILRTGTMKVTRSEETRGSGATSSASQSEAGSDSDGSAGRRRRSPKESPSKGDWDTEDPSSSEAPSYYFIEPGTVIGERSLLALLVRTRKNAPAFKKRDKGLKSIRVKHVRMDLTATCEDECIVLSLLITDLFDVLERFPGLVIALKACLRDHMVDGMDTTHGYTRGDR